MDVKIILTSDGSHSLLNTTLDETYHSRHGAVQESQHVFIKNGLEFFAERNPVRPIKVFEVGFGTGLNALLTVNTGLDVEYTSIEAFPLEESVYGQLNYQPKELLLEVHRNQQLETRNFKLRKIHATLEAISLPANEFDLVFYDAFAPSKQPSMWELPMIEKVCNALAVGGLFVTYCAKGQLKRDLKGLGMEVETLPGPPGKKEMVRGTKK